MNFLFSRREMIFECQSPYSQETTQALKSAFPYKWQTIRDYGFAHPDRVPFINEDPMLVMSLIDGLGTRWLNNNGTAYLNTGFVANYYSHSYQYDTIWKAAAIGNSTTMIGALSNGAAFGQMFLSGSECQVWGGYNWVNTGLTFNVAANTKYTDSIKFDFDNNKGYRTMNGASLEKNVDMRTRVTLEAYLFAYNNGGTATQKANCSFAKLVMYGDEVKVREMYPFIRNNVNGMIDVLSNTFYTNASVETFSITEQPI